MTSHNAYFSNTKLQLFLSSSLSGKLLITPMHLLRWSVNTGIWWAGIILFMCPANERQLYIVTSSFIVWVHTQNNHWMSDNVVYQCLHMYRPLMKRGLHYCYLSLDKHDESHVNSLWPGDTIWRHRSGSTLAQEWLGASWFQVITWANVDLSLVRLCGIRLRAISWVPMLLFWNVSLKSMLLKSLPHLPRANNEFMFLCFGGWGLQGG